jgi:hypothetical protein
MSLGAWTSYGPALREPIGRLHWAGAEFRPVAAARRPPGAPSGGRILQVSRLDDRMGRQDATVEEVIGRIARCQQGIEGTDARRGRVVSQTPSPGKRLGRDGVRLDVSR